MRRTKGAVDLPEAKREALIELKNNFNIFNRQLAKKYNCDKETVRNVLNRAEDAEKENIDSLSSKAHQRRPQFERPLTINIRLRRRLIRHAIKNQFQRRKK